MKKILFTFLICCSFHTLLHAQGGNGGRLEAYKIAFITNKLNLSATEAQKFWPIYNRYTAEIKQAKADNPKMDEIEMEEKIVGIRKKYKSEFTQALSEEKVNQFFKVDKEFNNSIRKELQERRQQRGSSN